MTKSKFLIILLRVTIVAIFIFLWEILSYKHVINSFVFSSPSKIIKCIYKLYKSNMIFSHIFITIKEIFVSFTLGIALAFIISIIFYLFPLLYRVFEPFLTIINSMPKVALGPLIIIIFGAGTKSIIIMALSITLILNIMQIYSGFTNFDKYLLKYLKIQKATKTDILKFLIIPSATISILNSLKINISMTLIGVIMGEFLVSKAGIGYLIVYGSQVFNLDLVLSGIVILMMISFIMYLLISLVENKIKKSLL